MTSAVNIKEKRQAGGSASCCFGQQPEFVASLTLLAEAVAQTTL